MQSRTLDRILVCVDGSNDGTLEYLRDLTPDTNGLVVLIHPGNRHRGRAATRNLAIPRLEADHVWLIDSDMRPSRDALRHHLRVAIEQKRVSVGAVDYDNASGAPWADYLNRRGRHLHADGSILPFTQFTTANSVLGVADLIAAGGFDERFDGYGGEDLDLALRLQSLLQVEFVNNRLAVATTTEHKTVEEAMAQFESYGAGNLPILEQLHPDAPRTFELDRLESRRFVDRLFTAAVNAPADWIARWLLRITPPSFRMMALNYLVVSAIWRGYRRSAGRKPDG